MSLCKTICLFLIFGSIASAQGEDKDTKWKRSRTLPTLAIAKYNEDPRGPAIMVLVPQVIFKKMNRTFMIKQDAISAKPNAAISDSKVVQASDQAIEATVTDLTENYGEMIRQDLPLSLTVIQRLDGTEVPRELASTLLKDATHVFYGKAPDEFLKAMFKDDLLVLLPIEGNYLPQASPVFDVKP